MGLTMSTTVFAAKGFKKPFQDAYHAPSINSKAGMGMTNVPHVRLQENYGDVEEQKSESVDAEEDSANLVKNAWITSTVLDHNRV